MCLLLLFVTRGAQAEAEHRVGLRTDDAALSEAITRSLSGWDVEVVRLTEEAPGSELPKASLWAREMASVYHAAAVVWLAHQPGARTSSLWLYDGSSGQV